MHDAGFEFVTAKAKVRVIKVTVDDTLFCGLRLAKFMNGNMFCLMPSICSVLISTLICT